MPGGDREHRLHGDVELAAEAAAAGGRDDADVFERQAEHAGDLVAIHHRRLRAGVDLHAVADADGVAGFGLDVGVLDEGGLERAFGCEGGLREGALGVAGFEDALGEHVVGPAVMERRRARQRARRRFR